MKRLLLLSGLFISLATYSQGVKISAMPELTDAALIEQAYFPVVYNLVNYKVLGSNLVGCGGTDSLLFGREDDTATENRDFYQAGYSLTIHGGVFEHGYGDFIDKVNNYSSFKHDLEGVWSETGSGAEAEPVYTIFRQSSQSPQITFEFSHGATLSEQLDSLSHFSMTKPGLTLYNASGRVFMPYLIDSAQDYVMFTNPTNGKVTIGLASSLGGGGGGSNTDSLFGVDDNVATANRTFAAGAYTFTQSYDAVTNSGLTISSTSTAAASDNQRLLNVSLSGANATSGEITSAIYVSNTHTGTTSTNIAVRGVATGGTLLNHAFWGTSDGGGATILGENSGNGNGVQGSAGASGSAVYGVNTSNGYGLFGVSNGGFGMQAVTYNTVTNTRLSVARFTRQIVTNTAAASIGGQIILEAPTTTASVGTTIANIGWSWDDATNATRSGRIDFSVVENGASAATVFTIDGSGNVMLEQSGKALALEDNTGTKWYITVNTSGVLSTSTTAP